MTGICYNIFWAFQCVYLLRYCHHIHISFSVCCYVDSVNKDYSYYYSRYAQRTLKNKSTARKLNGKERKKKNKT